MLEEQRSPQNLNLMENPWHLCKQGEAVTRAGWIPGPEMGY